MALSAKLASLFVEVVINTTRASNQLRGLRVQAGQTRESLAGIGLGAAGIFAVVKAGESLIKTQAEIERGFGRIRAVTDESVDSFERFKTQILETGRNLRTVSIGDFQTGLRVAAQLGIRGAGNLTEFAGIASQLSVLTDTDIEKLSDQLGALKEVFNLDTAGVRAFGDALVVLANQSVATEAHIIDITSRLAGMAQGLGLTAEETAAFSASMKDAGVRTEIAGSALARLFTKLSTESIKVTEALQFSTEQAREFLDLLAYQPAQAVLRFFERLNELGPRAAGVLKELQLSEARTASALLSMARALGAVNSNLDVTNDKVAKANALSNKSATVVNDLMGRLVQLKNAFTELGVVIAETFDFRSAIDMAIREISRLRDAFKANDIKEFVFWVDEAFGLLRGNPNTLRTHFEMMTGTYGKIAGVRAEIQPRSRFDPKIGVNTQRRPGPPPDIQNSPETFARAREQREQVEARRNELLTELKKHTDIFNELQKRAEKGPDIPDAFMTGIVDAWKQANLDFINRSPDKEMLEEQRKAREELEEQTKVLEKIRGELKLVGGLAP